MNGLIRMYYGVRIVFLSRRIEKLEDSLMDSGGLYHNRMMKNPLDQQGAIEYIESRRSRLHKLEEKRKTLYDKLGERQHAN
ncbi:hypothetical protein HY448_01900 [Candidatus Pacearchaeota archaeon]|nr:hypothetical protein [Candidatus Pacearchaeota archaeon]